MTCKNCELTCKNKGKKDEEIDRTRIPDWCPDSTVKYPSRRGRGDGVANYGANF